LRTTSARIEVAEFAEILYQQITATIEKQKFDIAYNQGKSLDLETVVRELLTEFGA
jgi:hypothetical protein